MLDGYFLDRLGAGVDTALAQALDALAARGTREHAVHPARARHCAGVSAPGVGRCGGVACALASSGGRTRMPPNVRLRLEMGRHVLGEDYVRAQHGRAVLRREIDRALDGVDALVLPALSIEAPPIGAVSVAVAGGTEPVRTAMLRCTQPFNLSGHPAISLPAGRPRRMPVGPAAGRPPRPHVRSAPRRARGRAGPRRRGARTLAIERANGAICSIDAISTTMRMAPTSFPAMRRRGVSDPEILPRLGIASRVAQHDRARHRARSGGSTGAQATAIRSIIAAADGPCLGGRGDARYRRVFAHRQPATSSSPRCRHRERGEAGTLRFQCARDTARWNNVVHGTAFKAGDKRASWFCRSGTPTPKGISG